MSYEPLLCGECRFYDADAKLCRVTSPDEDGSWPTVTEIDWCGEAEPIPSTRRTFQDPPYSSTDPDKICHEVNEAVERMRRQMEDDHEA